RYQHPKKEVYQRYGELGIERLRTDRTGALTLDFGPRLEIRAYRQTNARYDTVKRGIFSRVFYFEDRP
ncbi:MAG: hypothetical protein EOO04_17870, partial [Chitinophagaceae bacterium]